MMSNDERILKQLGRATWSSIIRGRTTNMSNQTARKKN